MVEFISSEDNPVGYAGRFAFIHARTMEARAWSGKAFKDQCAQPGIFALLHRNDKSEVDGFLLLRIAADECEILTLAVLPDCQRRGIATHLLYGGIEEMRRRGGGTCFLEVAEDNQAALALYEKLGFRQMGRRKAYYSHKIDALLLCAAIPELLSE